MIRVTITTIYNNTQHVQESDLEAVFKGDWSPHQSSFYHTIVPPHTSELSSRIFICQGKKTKMYFKITNF